MSRTSRKQKVAYPPFWFPAANYFMLTLAAGVAVFVVVWGVLHGEDEEFPLIAAGLGFFLVVVVSVVLRGRVVRKFQARMILRHDHIHHSLGATKKDDGDKLTIEKNSAILKEIVKKSDAAKVLGNLADAHWGVFELCDRYLEVSSSELGKISAGSPRIPAIIKSRRKVESLRREHLLAWASNESKKFTQEAQIHVTMSEKIKSAKKALMVLESAKQFYPEEAQLIDSAAALEEFIGSVVVQNKIEKAERAEFKGEIERASSLYRDALYDLARDNERTADKELIAEEIRAKIALLQARRAKDRAGSDR